MDLDELNAEREREIARLLKQLAKLGKQYTVARSKIVAIRNEAEPIVVELALFVEQKDLKDAFQVVRETIRRVEAAYGIDRRLATIIDRDKWPDVVRTKFRTLERLGRRYTTAREKATAIRLEAEPIIVTLARLNVDQKVIAAAFEVVRETIRRVEMANGVDRGDPRIKPGSRAGRDAGTPRKKGKRDTRDV